MEAVIRAKVQLINHWVKKAHRTVAVITIKADKCYNDKKTLELKKTPLIYLERMPVTFFLQLKTCFIMEHSYT